MLMDFKFYLFIYLLYRLTHGICAVQFQRIQIIKIEKYKNEQDIKGMLMDVLKDRRMGSFIYLELRWVYIS